ncbi:amino acid ABC transporter permease [Trinickia caryophylli]|uniref:Glutamate/aspartate import permease protein GltK n=2 Tax=Burkholderiaceae TaxID=119060 RepID=A0A1X7H7J2_TRICW|nr:MULTISPECIES: amino acid ABC transporter permease [Burkholderiaceae]PMS09446.1 amino acid ABC transporter permease [Trinickia caryophylli]TFE40644.1 amino acid ABC transporter permease [Paraburkholderia dipogonis]TRX14122.1 amino acid ABC transporter permease [Trinickia caryophylli]WQE13943.1 amino acid ABC transporter permease [Trinickia caryophylli]SMF81043.1 amino acid ABC transporter membrane protein 2, PAAT family [Trinickia caryophylli]
MFDILRDNWTLLLIGQYPHGPLGGIVLTILLSLSALVIAFPLGILVALARISPLRFLRAPATGLVYMVRGIPLLMVIFWVYFLVPVLTGYPVTGFVTMLCALVIYDSAYLGEIIRAGIEGLPKGQAEASRALGMSYMKTMRAVILPQALYNVVPSMVTQFVSTIKETSLGYIINVQEISFAADQINNRLLTKPFPVYLILALSYFALCYALTQLAQYLERRVTRKRAGVVAKTRKADAVALADPLPTEN